jgi:hypothetical protein
VPDGAGHIAHLMRRDRMRHQTRDWVGGQGVWEDFAVREAS